MKKKTAVIGVGPFGYAMAHYLTRLGHKVRVYDSNPDVIESLKATGRHPLHLSEFKIGENITPCGDVGEAIADCSLVVTATSAQRTRAVAKSIKKYIGRKTFVLNLAKGLELETNMRMSEVFEDEIGGLERFAALSGGMFASELIGGRPLYATIASRKKIVAKVLSKRLRSDTFYPKPSDDLVGVELAGPLKNVIAITAGMGFGLGYEHASISGFIAALSGEVEELALALGARRETFSVSSQAWGADLMTTCFGKSRNRSFGIEIGRGGDVEDILARMKEKNELVEGYPTAKAVYELARRKGIKAPLIEQTYLVLHEGKDVREAIPELMKYGANGR